MNKVVLILSDGMRPDAVMACNHPMVKTFLEKGKTSLNAASVVPPVTLPCHMSLVLSVDPERHGVITNTYAPPVRPIPGIFEVLSRYDKKCAFFYGWGQLKDIYQPTSLAETVYYANKIYGYAETNDILTGKCIESLKEGVSEFYFLYLPEVDEVGHKFGWMSDEYMKAVYHTFVSVQQVYEQLDEGDVILLTADHGGHDRRHGEEIPEDMTIPFFAIGKPFEPGTTFETAGLKDIAPTIAALFNVKPDEDWEGKSLL